MLEALRRRFCRGPLVALLAVGLLMTTFLLPSTAHADHSDRSSGGLHRTLGGAAGIAAGSIGGAALASAVIASAGIAAWGPLAVILIGSSITVATAFAGGKLGSFLGLSLDRALGRDATWMMVGAAAGAIAAIALIPAMGPLAGAGGLVVKGLLGGIVGGVAGKLLAPTLESVATPRSIYATMGGLVGGLGFGIPGAIAGAVGGYAIGAIFGDHFFADEDKYADDYVDDTRDWFDDKRDRFEDWRWDIQDWVEDRTDSVRDWWDERWHDDDYYGYEDDGRWRHYRRSRDYGYYEDRGYYGDDWDEDVSDLRGEYYDALEEFEELNSEGANHRARYRALRKVREAEQAYRDGIRGGW